MSKVQIEHVLKAVKEAEFRDLNEQQNQTYAVLLPLVEEGGKLHILFEVRAKQLKSQPGEICFPGGKVDGMDAGFMEAAIRETSEELGISPQHLVDVYPLNYQADYLNLYPFVGRLLKPEKITPEPDEVDAVFMISLDELLLMKPLEHVITFAPTFEDDFPFDLIPNGRNYQWSKRTSTQYFYLYEDKVIWGLTAGILHHFLEIVSSCK